MGGEHVDEELFDLLAGLCERGRVLGGRLCHRRTVGRGVDAAALTDARRGRDRERMPKKR